MSRLLKILAYFFGVIILITLATITTVDRSPIQEQDFFQETFSRLDTSTWASSQGDAWLAGWAEENVTPDQPAELVGYAPRGPYEFVQDSSFVKALTLSNGKTQVAWLSFELLIVHPFLADQVREGVKKSGLKLDQLIFTATHTHSGMGGYMPGFLGDLAFGGYDEQVVDLLVQKSVKAIKQAIATQDTVSISYRKTNAPDHVSNRFIKDGPYDPFVRQLIFSRKDGKKALFFTYSAHATCLSSKFMGLSGDYPKFLTQNLEKREYDFALYAAGTVGSHRPMVKGNTPEKVQEYAASLDSVIWLRMSNFASNKLPKVSHSRLDIGLREPHLRISDDLRIRPWVFHQLIGKMPAYLDITQIGNVLMISSSGELSGVFYAEWEQLAQSQGLKLIVTVFNGSYIGYINPDELYDEHYHEVREMNWFGPGNGYYFDQLIKKTIQKAGQQN